MTLQPRMLLLLLQVGVLHVLEHHHLLNSGENTAACHARSICAALSQSHA
jgi:hypothetical protein